MSRSMVVAIFLGFLASGSVFFAADEAKPVKAEFQHDLTSEEKAELKSESRLEEARKATLKAAVEKRQAAQRRLDKSIQKLNEDRQELIRRQRSHDMEGTALIEAQINLDTTAVENDRASLKASQRAEAEASGSGSVQRDKDKRQVRGDVKTRTDIHNEVKIDTSVLPIRR